MMPFTEEDVIILAERVMSRIKERLSAEIGCICYDEFAKFMLEHYKEIKKEKL